jgi:hypothetical protein
VPSSKDIIGFDNRRVEEVSPVSTMHMGLTWPPCPINNLQIEWFGTSNATPEAAKVNKQRATVNSLFASVKEKK